MSGVQRMSLVSSTRLTRIAAVAALVIAANTALFLAWQYASLPDILPVHFRPDGWPNGWQFKSPARVLIPLLVQAALIAVPGAVSLLLLSRSHGAGDDQAPDARVAASAAEGVALLSLVWIAFQGYAAWALVAMWRQGRGPLGPVYHGVLALAVAITVVVGIRANRRLGRPEPRPDIPAHWRFEYLYVNAADPALFVPTRHSEHWTLNFGRPVAAALMGLILLCGIVLPTVILLLLLR